MRMRLIMGWVLVLSLVAAIGYAQQPPARALTLAEAIQIARQNSPDYRATTNDRWVSGIRSTSSLLQFVVPSADLSAAQFRSAAGQRSLGTTVFTQPAYHGTQWNLDFGLQLSGRTFANRGLARAMERATDEDISAAGITLETQVVQAYVSLGQAQAQATLAGRSLERVNENLNLAQARYQVGQGTLIDVRRAEVDKGTAEVTLLRANQAVGNATLVLFQYLGVPAPEPLVAIQTDSFPVIAPPWSEDSLVAVALRDNPVLRALRARAQSARWNTRATYSEFLPSLRVSAGYGRTQYTPAGDSTVRTTNPWNYSIGISLPLFEPLQRNVQVQQARADEDDARQLVRRNELLVRATVVAALSTVVADYQAIAVQQHSKQAASEALDLAQQRYRVGSGNYLELLDARLAADQADNNYVKSVYDYHSAIASLENAVGRRLR
jgi:outer membrane protein